MIVIVDLGGGISSYDRDLEPHHYQRQLHCRSVARVEEGEEGESVSSARNHSSLFDFGMQINVPTSDQ